MDGDVTLFPDLGALATLAPEVGAEAVLLGLALVDAAVGEVDLLAGMPSRAMAASAVSLAGGVVLAAATGGKLLVLARCETGEVTEFPLRGDAPVVPAAVGVVPPEDATDDGEGRSGMDALRGAPPAGPAFMGSKPANGSAGSYIGRPCVG